MSSHTFAYNRKTGEYLVLSAKKIAASSPPEITVLGNFSSEETASALEKRVGKKKEKEAERKGIWLPTDLFAYLLQKKITKSFRLYIFLACRFSGKFLANDSIWNDASARLQVKSVRTIHNLRKNLLALGLLGHSKKSGYYFIRGKNRLREIFQLKRKRVAFLPLRYLTDLEAFSMAIVIADVIGYQRQKKLIKTHNSTRKKMIGLEKDFPVSVIYLEKKLKRSRQTIHMYKKRALELGLLGKKSNLIPLNIEPQFRKSYLRAHPEHYGQLRTVMGKLHRVGTDTFKISPLLHLKFGQ